MSEELEARLNACAEDYWGDLASEASGTLRRYRMALERLINACDAGNRFERGAGGMTIDAQIRRTVINGVSAWEVENARDFLLTGALHDE